MASGGKRHGRPHAARSQRGQRGPQGIAWRPQPAQHHTQCFGFRLSPVPFILKYQSKRFIFRCFLMKSAGIQCNASMVACQCLLLACSWNVISLHCRSLLPARGNYTSWWSEDERPSSSSPHRCRRHSSHPRFPAPSTGSRKEEGPRPHHRTRRRPLPLAGCLSHTGHGHARLSIWFRGGRAKDFVDDPRTDHLTGLRHDECDACLLWASDLQGLPGTSEYFNSMWIRATKRASTGTT